MPGTKLAFTTCVDPISPPQMHQLYLNGGVLVEAPGTAPGPQRLFRKPFSAIAGEPAL